MNDNTGKKSVTFRLFGPTRDILVLIAFENSVDLNEPL